MPQIKKVQIGKQPKQAPATKTEGTGVKIAPVLPVTGKGQVQVSSSPPK
jgi:hypothetical protein